ncbi:helix-turn-helix domain-containing protein [Brevibacterium salitolerans]
MPLRSDWSEALCPVQRALEVVGDPWVLLIVRNVLHGNGRFEALRASLGISEAVLSRRLHGMVEAGLLTRAEYSIGNRTRWGYAATEAAAELLPILQQLALWGEKHTPLPAAGAHMAMVHETCGSETRQGQICSTCGEAMASEEMIWVKPWKGSRDHLVGPGVVVPG